MTRKVIQSRVGPDGMLHLEVPWERMKPTARFG